MVQASGQPIAERSSAPITLRELEQAVRAADAAAVLVAPRILARVIKQNALLPGWGLRVPHRKGYTLARAELLSLVAIDELDLPPGTELAETVILLARPSPDRLAMQPAADNLVACWRLLFHARVHLAFEQLIAEGRFGPAAARRRIEQIGATEFSEIRAVLKQEDFLLPPPSEMAAYVEFAALFLELRYFADGLLGAYFPGIEDLGRIEALLGEDIDAEELYQSTRLPGAPESPPRPDAALEETAKATPEPQPPPTRRRPSTQTFNRLLKRAKKVAARGNLVRAAILRVSAAERGLPDQSRSARSAARADMDALAVRLQEALRYSDEEREDWARSLALLANQAARGFWNAEARLLYDLQKVCVDYERGIYTFDFYRWAKSGFRAPLKRPLPGQRHVMFSKHLRGALRRLPAVRLSDRMRARLGALLQSAVHRAEDNLRSRFRPAIAAALDHVRLTPQNLPERVAREKLIDELLDRVVERGFLLMGDLRDALSRNNLKLPDVASVQQFVLGDQLLRTNRQLADHLDGVYRPGEIYLTLPQRLSSLAFGTPLGRFLTRYVVLPFGGAFLVQKGLQHIIAPHSEQTGSDVLSLVSLVYIGLFFLGLLHSHRFRMTCLDVLWAAGRLARTVLIDLPGAVLQMPVVQAIVHSLYFRLLQRGLFKPLLVTALITPALSYVLDYRVAVGNSVVAFLLVNLVLNSRLGRNVDELVTDWLARTWHRFRIHVLATLFRFIMDVFNSTLESIERMLYTVDEWLRFRSGESVASITMKAVLGFVWFFVNYFIRFCVNLLIEPQVNPIKHFPVVTVSHKILLPLAVPLISVLKGPLGTVWADTIGTTVVLLLPGVFGFLVWELKENWRLYAANRPQDLTPVTIGHHGEMLLQFIKPGFRSGTLPKTYAKLRRASRKAYWTGKWKSAGKHLAVLRRAEEELRRFIDRDLLLLLKHSRGWEGQAITTGTIALSTNRITAELRCPELSPHGLWLSFHEEGGWLVAAVDRPGWLAALREPCRNTLDNALVGFYKMAGIDVVVDQLLATLDPLDAAYEIDEDGLRVWPRRAPEDVRRYGLRDWPPTERKKALPVLFPSLAEVEPERLAFSRSPVAWQRWVAIWDLDESQGGTFERTEPGITMLPERGTAS